ncbi:MAG: CocE/NonD family hydrolase [Alphaproteobacteria bacterium]|nr:CocE/NonD family hydrolase [Alphaproteobacteria bacterium]
MTKAPPDIIVRPGLPPAEQKYPGHGYRIARENGMIIERDVAVPMRDGANIYVDIFRPEKQDEKVPALVAWSAYGKHHPFMYEVFFKNGDVRKEWYSRYTSFEGPDPAYWVPRGYAVIHVDPRGTWHSEGEARYWSQEEGTDGYDLVEWAGVREWCNGKVGMSGVSYLAIIQWQIAATQPPHLAAINPWEGLSDMYREFAFHGGIPETRFMPVWHRTVSYGLGHVEDVPMMAKEHPFFDRYWATKVADFSKINVPTYVVASWADQGLHTRGTLEGFKRIASKYKWLEIHGRKKWENFYQSDSVEKQRAFFDHFLKGVDNDVLRWPAVRLEVRERYYVGRTRTEREWPLARTAYKQLFLDASSGSLSSTPIKAEASVSYDTPAHETRCPAAYRGERAQFDYVFAEAAELVGHMKLRLWVEAIGADDMDLFVAIQKFDRDGQYVPFAAFSALEDGPVALGWLRASHRELDQERSTPYQPWLLHQRALKLQPGIPVPVDIEIWPSGTRFAAGEVLRIVVQGSDIYKYASWVMVAGHPRTTNAGLHVIHTGGQYDSYLLIPVIPSDG